MKVGSLCECIENMSTPTYNGETWPFKGQILTVREIVESCGELWLKFEEIKNPPIRLQGEARFTIKKFRELLPPEEIAEALEEVNEVLKEQGVLV